MNSTLDPTLDAIESLKDSSRWHVVKNVPIFKPHVRKDAQGKAKFQVIHDVRLHDSAPVITLTDVLRACQDRDAPGKLQIGHTLKDQYDENGIIQKVDEEDQPDMVGIFQNYHIGHYGPKNQVGLLADFYYMAEQFEEAKKYRFRSVEFYPQTKEITTVALLKKDPELDMGILFFERAKGPCYYYSSIPMMNDASQVIPDEEEDKVDEEYSKKFMACMSKHFPKFVEQYGCGPGMASSTNVVVPQGVGKNGQPKDTGMGNMLYEKVDLPNGEAKPPADPLVKENAEMYARNQALEARLAALETERKADQLSIHYERQLHALDPQGMLIKFDKELASLRKMNEEQAKEHFEMLERVTQYSRSPVGQPLVGVDGQPIPRTGPTDQYEKQAVIDFVTAVNEERDRANPKERKPRMTFSEGLLEYRKQGR